MTTRTINWCTKTELSCGAVPATAYICVPASIVSPSVETDSGFVEATLTGSRVSTCRDVCGACGWVYTLEYDDAQLVSGYALTQAVIKGVICSDCLVDFIVNYAGTSTGITCEEVTDCVDISADAGNALELRGDGLYATGGGSTYTFSDTASVDLTLTGSDVTADVLLSADAGNIIEERVDGLYATGGGASFITSVTDTASVDLTVTAGALTADVEISATGGNQVSIAGDGLLVPKAAGLTVTDTASVDLTLTAGDLSADVEISATANNQVSIAGDGLLVPKAAGLTVTDTASVDLTLTSGALSADVEISADEGNLASIKADGIFVPQGMYQLGPVVEYATSLTTETDVTVSINASAAFTNKFLYQVIGQDVDGNFLVSLNLNYYVSFSAGTAPHQLRVSHPFTFPSFSAEQMYRGFSYRVISNNNKSDSQFIADPTLSYFQVYFDDSGGTWVPSSSLNVIYIEGFIWVASIAGYTPPATSPLTGWQGITAPWSYASATTVTVPTDATLLYEVGDRVRFKQGAGYKYFYVIGVAATVLTLTGGTDYTVANAAITEVGVSKAPNPVGFPSGFNYAPTYTGFSVDPTYTSKRFSIIGRECTFGVAGVSVGTSNTTAYTVSLPVTATTAASYLTYSPLSYGVDNGTSIGSGGIVSIAASATTASLFSTNKAAWTNSGNKGAEFVTTYEI